MRGLWPLHRRLSQNAVQINWDETTTNLNRKIAEYTKAVVDGRPCFHISLVIDVSPNCDCHPENDMPIVPNVGMFASFDPVALDMACVDAVNAQPPAGSAADDGEGHVHEHDHFGASTPTRTGAAVWSTARRSASASETTNSSRSDALVRKGSPPTHFMGRRTSLFFVGLHVLIEHVPHHLIGVEGVLPVADYAHIHVRMTAEEVHDGFQGHVGGLQHG